MKTKRIPKDQKKEEHVRNYALLGGALPVALALVLMAGLIGNPLAFAGAEEPYPGPNAVAEEGNPQPDEGEAYEGVNPAAEETADQAQQRRLEERLRAFQRPYEERRQFHQRAGIEEAAWLGRAEGTGEYVPSKGFRLLVNGYEVWLRVECRVPPVPAHWTMDLRGIELTVCPETGMPTTLSFQVPPEALVLEAVGEPIVAYPWTGYRWTMDLRDIELTFCAETGMPTTTSFQVQVPPEALQRMERNAQQTKDADILGIMPISGTLPPGHGHGFGPWLYRAGDIVTFENVSWLPGDSIIGLGLVCMETHEFRGNWYLAGSVPTSLETAWRDGWFAPVVINLGPSTISYTGWLDF